MKKAFTLAEIMIVLVVIGILTGILVPAAMNSMPNENVMKFKKAHNTLYRVINELVSSDKYYADGDLGKKPDGSDVTTKYLCETMADVLSTKSVNCSDSILDDPYDKYTRLDLNHVIYGATLNEIKKDADNACENKIQAGEEIVTTDGVVYYQVSPGHHFSWKSPDESACYKGYRYYGGKVDSENISCFIGWEHSETYQIGSYIHQDEYGLDRIYKIFCIDVDGIGKGEDPFGYGIRADGKIISGARADEWLNKTIQEKEQ